VVPLRPVMTTQENAAYDALPDTVECFRGCDRSVLTGASWSLDWEIANSFPFTNRYRAPSPVVVTARVKKDRILAIKLGREESEIITFSARRLKVKPADADRASAYHAANHAGLMLSLKTIEATQASAGPSTTALALKNRFHDHPDWQPEFPLLRSKQQRGSDGRPCASA
jgi:hypothetical protein